MLFIKNNLWRAECIIYTMTFPREKEIKIGGISSIYANESSIYNDRFA